MHLLIALGLACLPCMAGIAEPGHCDHVFNGRAAEHVTLEMA